MTWRDTGDAIAQIIKDKEHGAHVFYSHQKDMFEICRDSKNGKTAGDKISKESHRYRGFYDKNGVLEDIMDDLVNIRENWGKP